MVLLANRRPNVYTRLLYLTVATPTAHIYMVILGGLLEKIVKNMISRWLL